MDHEGRRDPFQSLYTHMRQPPKVIFYDFACQLSEYCRNREPSFFANTRFFMDKFHFWNHKRGACSRCFQVTRVPEYSRLNDSICEQWHADVDSQSRHMAGMTQLHFMFSLQTHMKQWALRKLAKLFRNVMPGPVVFSSDEKTPSEVGSVVEPDVELSGDSGAGSDDCYDRFLFQVGDDDRLGHSCGEESSEELDSVHHHRGRKRKARSE
jgi:hypothetical protein